MPVDDHRRGGGTAVLRATLAGAPHAEAAAIADLTARGYAVRDVQLLFEKVKAA